MESGRNEAGQTEAKDVTGGFLSQLKSGHVGPPASARLTRKPDLKIRGASFSKLIPIAFTTCLPEE
jgi:hypothetical protein